MSRLKVSDIRNLSIPEIGKLSGIKAKKQLDLLQASPPCQGFSVQGKFDAQDKRNYLYQEVIRITRALLPKFVVIENVKGMVMSKMAPLYLDMTSQLRKIGYKVHGEIMNAAYFGAHQSRERVIVVAVREDFGIEATLPQPQTLPKTFRETIYNFKPSFLEPRNELTPYRRARWEILKPGDEADKLYGWYRHSHVKFDWDSICNTLVATDSSIPMHPDEPRRLYIEEMAILSGFPKDFIFTGNRFEQVRLVGNCLPAPLMKAIGKHLNNS